MELEDETSVFNEDLDDIGGDLDALSVYTDLFLTMSRRVNKQIILKGNVLLNMLVPQKARKPTDLDVSIADRELFNALKEELSDFSERLMTSGVASSYHLRDIASHSGGLDVLNEAGEKLYAVDVNLSNVSLYGNAVYNIQGELVHGSSVDKILRDKCTSILSKRRFKRIRDFYDVFIILDSGLEFDCEKILELMLTEFSNNASLAKQFDEFPFGTNSVLALRNLWNAEKFESLAPEVTSNTVEFSEALKAVYQVLEKLKRCYADRKRE